MTGKTVLITGCDRRYFHLLKMFVQSVADSGGLDRVELAVFDIDFSDKEKQWLATFATTIQAARSPLEPLLPPMDGPRMTLPSLVRPYFRDLFPGYDIYLYSDVDVWVQDWHGFELFIEGAARGRLAICPQVDRSYVNPKVGPAFRFNILRETFGSEAARIMALMPHMNAGIFGLPADAPHWARWAELWQKTLKGNSQWFGSGQAILTHMIYNEQFPAELLPATCNWMNHLAAPLWDEAQRCFVAPYLPHEKIYLMHMTAETKWQAQPGRTLQGNMLRDATVSYATFKRLRDKGIDGSIVNEGPEGDSP